MTDLSEGLNNLARQIMFGNVHLTEKEVELATAGKLPEHRCRHAEICDECIARLNRAMFKVFTGE